ncbi:MAG TPA: 3-isopropylmalate dehydratase small subunit [Candidatus Lokiarchaeia archaeon]|nr:3-isopropylmalate dehydratase small subunit [Candidatus Lokiarchaeia archaeon]
MTKFQGRAWVFGDNIDTDLIVPSKYLTEQDPTVMASGTFEHIRPEFAREVQVGDIIVAGRNFGSGSSREEAPFVLKALGIRAIVAQSFARIFYRNAINLGLPALEVPLTPGDVADGAQVEVDWAEGILTNLDTGDRYEFARLPAFLQEILDAGGALNWLQSRGK